MARERIVLVLGLSLLLSLSRACEAQNSFLAQDLHFQGIFASKQDEPTIYLCLGSGFLRPMTAGDDNAFIKQRLEAHPHALATPISKENLARLGSPSRPAVYLWIEDKGESLNVALVREGIYPGGVMLDMVEAQQRLQEKLHDPMLSSVRKQIQQELEATPSDDLPKRLVTDAEYTERMKQVRAAETQAQEEKKGI